MLGCACAMTAKTIQERLSELPLEMAGEKDPERFRKLVKEMSDLLAVQEMERLLEAGDSRLRAGRGSPKR
jgi:hypothetical protein